MKNVRAISELSFMHPVEASWGHFLNECLFRVVTVPSLGCHNVIFRLKKILSPGCQIFSMKENFNLHSLGIEVFSCSDIVFTQIRAINAGTFSFEVNLYDGLYL